MVRVKAWAWYGDADEIAANVEKANCFEPNFPCTILIDRKHLKEAK